MDCDRRVMRTKCIPIPLIGLDGYATLFLSAQRSQGDCPRPWFWGTSIRQANEMAISSKDKGFTENPVAPKRASKDFL